MSIFPSVISESTTHSTSPFSNPPPGDLVLLIEDDSFVADVLERMLERLGKRTLRARSGLEGTQMFAAYEQHIAVVVLDCFLPDVSGVALCRVLRKRAPALPIVLTSGCDQLDVKALVENGPTTFLPKPFYPRQVEELFSKLVGVTS